MLKPTWGEARIDGLSVGPVNARQVRSVIGYVPDYFGSYEDMVVREYLEFFAAAYDIHGPKRKQVVDDVLATGGTARAASRLVRRLGGDLHGLGEHVLVRVAERNDFDGRHLGEPPEVALAIPAGADQAHALGFLVDQLSAVCAERGHAAVDREDLPGDVLAGGRCEQQRGALQVVVVADAAQRRMRGQRAYKAGGPGAGIPPVGRRGAGGVPGDDRGSGRPCVSRVALRDQHPPGGPAGCRAVFERPRGAREGPRARSPRARRAPRRGVRRRARRRDAPAPRAYGARPGARQSDDGGDRGTTVVSNESSADAYPRRSNTVRIRSRMTLPDGKEERIRADFLGVQYLGHMSASWNGKEVIITKPRFLVNVAIIENLFQ